MGANVSKQITALAEKAVTETAVQFTQQNTSQVHTTQDVEIVNVIGNVLIDEVNLSQRVEVNVTQSMTALSDNSAQITLSDKIIQESKQVVSGISLAQANYAEKNMEKIVETLNKYSTSIVQICSASAKQTQTVKVKGVQGSLRLNRLVLSQVSALVSECVQASSSANTALTDLETDVVQSTEQTLDGINPLYLIGLLGVGLVGVPLVLGSKILASLGPILIAGGAGAVGYSLVMQKTRTEMKLFSGLYNVEAGRVDVTDRFYKDGEPSLANIVAVFETDSAYAFDLDRCNKRVHFYTDPGVLGATLTTQELTPNPKLVTTKSEMKNGDVYYDSDTGAVVRKCGAVEVPITTLTKNKTFTLKGYRFYENNTAVEAGPWPNLTNVSGWKETSIDYRILFSGIVGIVAGIVLMLLVKSKASSPAPVLVK